MVVKAHAQPCNFGFFKWMKKLHKNFFKNFVSLYKNRDFNQYIFSVFNPHERKIGISTHWFTQYILKHFLVLYTYCEHIFHLFLLLFDRTDRKNVFSIFIYCFFNAHLCMRVSGQSKFFFRFT